MFRENTGRGEEEKTLYRSNRECQRQRGMRELLYGTLSLMPAHAQPPEWRESTVPRSSSSLELHLIFKRTRLSSSTFRAVRTRRKSFFGRSVRLTTESGQWQSCGREIIYYNICVHAVYTVVLMVRLEFGATLSWVEGCQEQFVP